MKAILLAMVLAAGALGQQSQKVEPTDGPTLYRAHCAVCHGADAKGTGPMAKFLKTRASDLTTVRMREGGKFPLGRVQRVISGEEELLAGHGTTAMPVWGPVFSQVAWDRDLGRVRIYNLAKYIEGLQK
jgi:mono/diheme cytochrome c family protein